VLSVLADFFICDVISVLQVMVVKLYKFFIHHKW